MPERQGADLHNNVADLGPIAVATTGPAWSFCIMPIDQEPRESFDEPAILGAVTADDFESFVDRAYLALEQGDWVRLLQRVAALHRSGEINLLSAAVSKAEGRLPHAIEYLLGAVLPDLDVSLEAILAVLPTIAARWSGAGVPYFMRNVFSEWCDRNPDRSDAALEAFRRGDVPSELLVPILLAGMRAAQPRYIDILSEMLSGPSLEEANAAASVLGYATAATPVARQEIFQILKRAIADSDDERLVARFQSLLGLSLGSPKDEAIAVAAVAAVAGRATPALRTAAANCLAQNRAGATRPGVAAICDMLARIEVGEAETIDAVDHLIYGLLATPEADLALDLIEKLLREDRATLKDLDSTAHQIMTSKTGLHQRVVADWLVDGASGMMDAVHDLVMLVANDPPIFTLDFGGRGLSGEAAASVGRRTISSLILFPETAASILVSLLRTGPADAMPLIEEMMLDPLLLSYWETPRKYLEEIAPTERADIAALIARNLSKLDEYIAAIETAGVIAELRPSERHRFIAAVQRAEVHRSIAKSAGKGPLASLFPTSMLLYGDSAVSDVFAVDGSTSRNEFRLGTVETSQEIARLDSIDPIGLWYQRMLFSMGKARG